MTIEEALVPTPVEGSPSSPPAEAASAAVEAPAVSDLPVADGQAAPKAEEPKAPAIEPAKVEDSLLGTAKPEEKPAAEVKAEPKAEEKPVEAPKPVELPPIEYKPFTLPEGLELDPTRAEDFTKVLGEFRAPQELGQKLVEFYSQEVERFTASQREAFAETRKGWRQEITKDPELGGNRTQTVLTSCASVLDQFGTPELRQMLNYTGAGDHPAMLRFVYAVSKVLKEGGPVSGGKAPAQPASRAARRYNSAT